MTTSPYGNELLLAFAKRAIDEMQLGRGTHPDLLCLSFSANDLIGHCWGPDSQEVLDITLRTDRTIKELLDYLDEKVGKGQYVFALSADHGVCPIPEVSLGKGKDAGRVPEELFTTRTEAFLNETFAEKGKKLPWVEKPTATGIYLNQALLKELNLAPERVERALAEWLVKQPGVRSAYTRTQLAAGKIADDPFAESELASFHPDCSGDVTVLLKPYWQISKPITSDKMVAYRTSHGSPYDYDTHVPLFVMGPGIRPGLRDERVPPQVVAAILARALGIPPPNQADYGVPRGLFDK
jgi:predicted AlkP superfamily pyrophosphatase or phosphodiesterase